MPSLAGSELARTRSRLATATRSGDPAKIADAKRDHAAASIAAHVERVVAEAPPFDEATRARLAALLGGSKDVQS